MFVVQSKQTYSCPTTVTVILLCSLFFYTSIYFYTKNIKYLEFFVVYFVTFFYYVFSVIIHIILFLKEKENVAIICYFIIKILKTSRRKIRNSTKSTGTGVYVVIWWHTTWNIKDNDEHKMIIWWFKFITSPRLNKISKWMKILSGKWHKQKRISF